MHIWRWRSEIVFLRASNWSNKLLQSGAILDISVDLAGLGGVIFGPFIQIFVEFGEILIGLRRFKLRNFWNILSSFIDQILTNFWLLLNSLLINLRYFKFLLFLF